MAGNVGQDMIGGIFASICTTPYVNVWITSFRKCILKNAEQHLFQSIGDDRMDYWYRKDGNTSQGLRDLWAVTGGHARLMVEVGSADGGSAIVWNQLCPEMQIVCVDPWTEGTGYDERVFQGFIANTAHIPYLSFLRMTSLEAVRYFPDNILDFVYFDAMHTYKGLSADLTAWMPKVKPCGWYAGHDFTEEFVGVIQAVLFHKTGPLYTFCDTSWAFQRPVI
jgi:hypothetical protein